VRQGCYKRIPSEGPIPATQQRCCQLHVEGLKLRATRPLPPTITPRKWPESATALLWWPWFTSASLAERSNWSLEKTGNPRALLYFKYLLKGCSLVQVQSALLNGTTASRYNMGNI